MSLSSTSFIAMMTCHFSLGTLARRTRSQQCSDGCVFYLKVNHCCRTIIYRQCGTTCIIHTASPPHGLKDPSLYWKVNVDGTKAVIAAAQETGVKKLVYTSSAGVVFSGSDVIDIDERAPMPEKPFDVYNDSKAHGEAAVLEANGKEGLLTVALRPAGIFGYASIKIWPHFHQLTRATGPVIVR